MYKKIIFLAVIMLSAVITFAQPSQYTPMTAQGYQFKRILCDSTLHLPSFCGVPNLRNSTAKNGALAIDTCNNKLYQWTRLSGWSIVGGTTIDTTSLSNRINTKIDSLKRSTDSIFARVNGVWKFQYKDSIGGGSTPSLQAVTDVGASTTNMITASTNYATTEYNKLDVGNQVYYPFYATDGDLLFPNESYIRMGNFGGLEPEFYNGTTQTGGSYNRLTPTYLEFNDDNLSVNLRKPSTASADDHYLPISDNTTDTLATTSEVALKLNISDTASMLTKYLRKTDTASLSSRINLKVNIADTASMLLPYLRKVDTTNRFVNNITRTAGKDSIIFFIGGTRYAIKDSVGGGGGSAAGSTGNVQFNNGGAFAGSNNLFWDNTNGRLGIGTASPAYAAQINYSDNSYNEGIRINNSNTGTNALSGIGFMTNTVLGGFMAYNPSNYANAAQASTMTFTSAGANKLGFIANANSTPATAQDIFFSTLGTNTTYQMQIKGNTGNVQIGTNTDAGYKFDVNGTTRLNGNTTLGSTGFWDNTNSRLGIGTTSPSNRFHLTVSITS
jgi:hypothetical protein